MRETKRQGESFWMRSLEPGMGLRKRQKGRENKHGIPLSEWSGETIHNPYPKDILGCLPHGNVQNMGTEVTMVKGIRYK